jgi:putative methionine-R-sulfoxide reductase with GAF domain
MLAETPITVTDLKDKSGLGEQTPGKLQEAGSALPGHAQDLKPASDYAVTVAEIVEAQHQIQLRHLALDEAMALVSERIVRITHASGAALGMLEGNRIRYRASVGTSALPLGSEVPLEAAICAVCVGTGEVLRTPDVNQESLFDPEPCRKRGIMSLMAVPIYHDGNPVGALEVYFDGLQGFAEQDIHTCQLMAGLVTEAFGRDAGSALRKSMAEERSSMLAAIEKIKPNLAALVGERAKYKSPESGGKTGGLPASVSNGEGCWKCGSALIEGEQFCGNCGAPRIGESDASTQSKLASALHMHQAIRELPFAPLNENLEELAQHNPAAQRIDGNTPSEATEIDETEDEKDLLQQFALPMLEDPMPEEPIAEEPVLKGKKRQENDALPAQSIAGNTAEESPEPVSAALQRTRNSYENGAATLMAPQEQSIQWSSAAKARNFLEGLSRSRTHDALGSFWHDRRGDFYLAVAIILVLVAIRWGLFSDRSAGVAGAGSAGTANSLRHKPPADNLSLFDKLLIDLGLAEAPEAPEYKYMGNPNTQVWIDTHTALYYCPGSELYGKTAKGRFASQHDAQLDQFEPASRRACD